MIDHFTAPEHVAAGPEHAPSRPSRHAALASAAATIRVRRGGRLAVEQILLLAAAILFPLGLVFILLGWEGAAHNGHTYAQISYLISGGIFGLGLSVAGGFMYFGYWLSRQITESRRQSALTVQALQRLEDLLDFGLQSGPAGRASFERPTGEVPALASPRSNGSVLYATPRGTLLHRPECPVVSKRTDLKAVSGAGEGYGLCSMCNAGAQA